MITDEMVEARINSLREKYNNPELYKLLKIVVHENMAVTDVLIAQGIREAADRVGQGFPDYDQRGATAFQMGRMAAVLYARAQELDPK